MLVRRVIGRSMEPALGEGAIVVATKRQPRSSDIVVAIQAGREIIKRVSTVRGGQYYLEGDNLDESTDSRHYGPVEKGAILGTVMFVLPSPVAPPKPLRPYAVWLGRISAILLIAMVLVHLYRIDTFIPLLDEVVPGSSMVASWAAFLIILTELFALPYAMRIRLSPLGHVVSGALLVFAPFWWVLIGVWTWGYPVNTAQLGQFYPVISSPLVVVLNVGWLAFSYWTLHLLGYNRLTVPGLLRK